MSTRVFVQLCRLARKAFGVSNVVCAGEKPLCISKQMIKEDGSPSVDVNHHPTSSRSVLSSRSTLRSFLTDRSPRLNPKSV